MSSRQALEPKNAGETLSLVFDFASQLIVGETVSSATASCSVYSGTDATPSSVLSGSATVSGTQVTQKVTGGTAGVTYVISVAATTSASNIITILGYLVVLPATI